MMVERWIIGSRETPYAAIARSAAAAPRRRLLLILAFAVAILAVAANGAATWPMAVLAVGGAAGAVASAALWGFVAQAYERRRSHVLLALEWLLATAGTALASIAVIALLLALLGRPWML
jgi:hypothetical protein